MTVLLASALSLVAIVGTAVVATSQPERQAVTLSFYGLTLTVLFLALQAPDVALSQLGVGAAIVPLMVMLAIRSIEARHSQPGSRQESGDGEPGQPDEQSGGGQP